MSSSGWVCTTAEVKKVGSFLFVLLRSLQFCTILDDVIDDASYGWNPLLEDQVHWCVWSAPMSIQVGYRLNILAEWLMRWDMFKEAEIALRKALYCGIKVKCLFYIRTKENYHSFWDWNTEIVFGHWLHSVVQFGNKND